MIDLASETAASLFAASPRPGVTGTLPVANGGTGVNTLDSLKQLLGISGSFWCETGSTERGLWNINTSRGTIRFMLAYGQYQYGNGDSSYTESPIHIWFTGMPTDQVYTIIEKFYLNATVSNSSISVSNYIYGGSSYLPVYRYNSYNWFCIGT